MAQQKPITHIKRVGGVFINFYQRSQGRIEHAQGSQRTLGAEKAQQSLQAESLRFAQRNSRDLIDWALAYTAEPGTATNVILLSGAPEHDRSDAFEIRRALKFILDVVARFAPQDAEAVAHKLVLGVVHLQKSFVEGMNREQAIESIQSAIDQALALVAVFEKQAEVIEQQAKREQFRLKWGARVRGIGLSMIGVGITLCVYGIHGIVSH